MGSNTRAGADTGAADRARLRAFEAMRRDVLARMASEKEAIDALRTQGREKSATFRQYMANRLVYQRILALYEEHGLLEPPAGEDGGA